MPNYGGVWRGKLGEGREDLERVERGGVSGEREERIWKGWRGEW